MNTSTSLLNVTSQAKKKKLYKYTAFFEPAEEGGYVVSVPALPGCVSQGETFEEAKKMVKDAIKAYIAILRQEGQQIPREKEEVITAPLYIPLPSRG